MQAKGTIRVETTKAERSVQGGITGISVSMLVRLGVDQLRAVTSSIALETWGGVPVRPRALPGDKPAKTLRVDRDIGHFDSLTRIEFFVPFRAIDLPPGRQDVAVRFAAIDKGPWASGRLAKDVMTSPPPPEQRYETVGEPSRFSFEMPSIHTRRVAVRHAEVAAGEYDDVTRNEILAALGTGGASLVGSAAVTEKYRERLSRPDLVWSVALGNVRIHRSSARQDAFSGTWSEWSPLFPVADDDVVSVCLADEDLGPFGRHDEAIGCVEGKPAELEAWSRDGKAPVRGKLVSVKLAASR